MKFNISTKTVASITLAGLFLWACNNKVNSQAKYKFSDAKKPGLAAEAGKVMVSDDEILQGIRGEIFQKEMEIFELKFNKLKSVLLKKLIDKAPDKKDMTNDQYMDKVIAKGIKISDKEVDAFIKEMKVPQQYINPQYKERVRQHLTMKKKKEAVDQWIMKTAGKDGVNVYLKKPERPFFKVEVGKAPVSTTKNTKVTVVEFSDFQCPHCKKAATDVLPKIKKKYGDKVKIAFKQYPLPFHNHAELAAIASLCANEQSSDFFWKMHDAMFNDQAALAKGALKRTAGKLGMDQKKFDACLDAEKYKDQVIEDKKEGRKIGVQATPTFFVNGRLVSGAQPIEVFSEIIDAEMAKK